MRYFLYIASPALGGVRLAELNNKTHFEAIYNSHMEMKTVVGGVYENVITHADMPQFKMLVINSAAIDDHMTHKAMKAAAKYLST